MMKYCLTAALLSFACCFFQALPSNAQTRINFTAMQRIKIVPKAKRPETVLLNHIGQLQVAINRLRAACQATVDSFFLPTASSSGTFVAPNASGGTYYNVDLTSGAQVTSINNLKAIQQSLQGDLDSMNEMSEMTSQQLQMAMNSYNQLIQALSNIEKTIEKTQQTIAQNIKS
jgi:peptidoglycan hydrolase CwlO-like protein